MTGDAIHTARRSLIVPGAQHPTTVYLRKGRLELIDTEWDVVELFPVEELDASLGPRRSKNVR